MNWYTIYHAYVSELANGAMPHGERQSFILDYNCIIFQQLIKNHIDVTAWVLHITGPLRGESIGLQCIPCVSQMENKSLLVQVISNVGQATSHYLTRCRSSSLTHICATRSLWCYLVMLSQRQLAMPLVMAGLALFSSRCSKQSF